jgi:protein-L-isoaspartate(D-aspartate) O-methyltransferase
MEYEKERRMMVDGQLRSRGIKDPRVLAAMETVDRHLFVRDDLRDAAYEDRALPTGEGQTISQPYMVAVMTELLELKGDERVLEVGTGSGYQSAVLSLLASEVFTVERVHSLAVRAESLLIKLGYLNVHVYTGDGTLGLPDYAPYDAIIVTAAAPKIPDAFVTQMKMGGRLVLPVGTRASQILYQLRKTPAGMSSSVSTPCVFVPLVGQNGWNDSRDY